MSDINEGPAFRPTPFQDPRESFPTGKSLSPSKFRSQGKHQQRRAMAFKAVHGKLFSEMTLEEKLAVREKMRASRA